MARGWLLALAVVAACGGGADGVELTSATPPYGPVTGGTRILLHGSGFVPLGAGSNRVMFGDHEAPLVATLDDGTLDVVVPAGDRPGAVEVMVLSGDQALIRAAKLELALAAHLAPAVGVGIEPLVALLLRG